MTKQTDVEAALLALATKWIEQAERLGEEAHTVGTELQIETLRRCAAEVRQLIELLTA